MTVDRSDNASPPPGVETHEPQASLADGAVDPTIVVRPEGPLETRDVERLRRENLRATMMMLLGVGAFGLMDTSLKVLSTSYPSMQVASIRGLSSLPIILVWIMLRGGFGQLRVTRPGLHLARGLLGIGILASFTFSLRHLPLAEAYSIFFVAPLLITAFAVPILGERVGWRRWAAIVVGLGGVLVILRPTGTGMTTLAGFAVLFTAVGYALSAIAVRVLGRTDSTESMVFWLMLIVGVGAGLIALPRWLPIRPDDWLVILALAVSGSLGQWAITEAFRRGEASFIAPFEYTALAWGTLFDWILWKTIPGPMTFVGSGIIVASGIYLIRRDRAVKNPTT